MQYSHTPSVTTLHVDRAIDDGDRLFRCTGLLVPCLTHTVSAASPQPLLYINGNSEHFLSQAVSLHWLVRSTKCQARSSCPRGSTGCRQTSEPLTSSLSPVFCSWRRRKSTHFASILLTLYSVPLGYCIVGVLKTEMSTVVGVVCNSCHALQPWHCPWVSTRNFCCALSHGTHAPALMCLVSSTLHCTQVLQEFVVICCAQALPSQ